MRVSCTGFEYDRFGSVVYNHSGSVPAHTPLFPVQIVETFVFFGIFVMLMIIHKKNRFGPKTVGMNFVLCGLGKFLLDFFRDSYIGGLSANQLISLALIIIGSGILLKTSGNPRIIVLQSGCRLRGGSPR